MSSNLLNPRHRTDAPAGWQPIGLPVPQAPEIPAAFVKPQLTTLRAIKWSVVPGAAITASVAIVGAAAAAPAVQGATPSVTTPSVATPTVTTTTPTTTAPSTDTAPVNVTKPNPDTNILDGGGLLPSLPGLQSLMPNLNGQATRNTQTPGGSTTVPGASYGTPSDTVQTNNGDDTYPNTASQTVDATDGGWYGYQEYSPWCWSRGVSCVNWNFSHEQQNGNGFLRINGTSLGVAPCVPNTGVGRFNSPLFTFNTRDAKAWKFDFDFRTTALVAGDGHATYSIQILDADGNVVTTTHGPDTVLPTNHWTHISNGFDGSKLVFGKQYRISIAVDVVHAETALTWGNLDFDNLKLTATPGDSGDTTSLNEVNGQLPTVTGTGSSTDASTSSPLGSLTSLLGDNSLPGDDQTQEDPAATPYILCKPSDSKNPLDAVTSLLTSRPEDFCQPANALGQLSAPLADAAEKIMSQPSISNLLDKASGVFAIADLQTGDFAGFVVGKGALPSTDPRDLVAYVKDGGIGQVGNYAVAFVTNAAGMVSDAAKNPIPTALNVATGQLGNALQLASDPGRLTRLPLDWQVGSVKWAAETILNPIIGNQDRDTELGGTVWSDADKDGKLDAGEKGVPGVKVLLQDANGNTYGTATTGPDGRYVFTDVTPRTDPSDYYVTFEPNSLPQGTQFTTQEAPNTAHGTTSYADPKTGMTPRIRLVRYQKDLGWNAGLVGVPTSSEGSTPGTATPGTTEGQADGGSSLPLIGSLPGLGSGSSDPVSSLTSTLGSLTGGLPGLSNPTGSSPTGDQPTSSDPLSSLTDTLGSLTGGLPGLGNPTGTNPSSNPSSNPAGTQPTGTQPSGSTPTGTTPAGNDNPTSSQPAGDQPTSSDPLSSLTDTLGSLTGGLPGLSNPTGSNPSSNPGTAPTGTTPTGTTPTGTTPAGNGNPTGTQPAGDQSTSSDPLSSLTSTLGSLTGGLPGLSSLTGSNPSSNSTGSNPSSNPGTAPAGTQPTGTTPTGSQPSGSTPANPQPANPQPADVQFTVGAPTVNGTAASDAPGPNVPAGRQITVAVPVTNTGSTPISSLEAQVPGEDGQLKNIACGGGIAPGATARCTITLPATTGAASYTLNIIGTSADGSQETKLCRFHYVGQAAAPAVSITPAATPALSADATQGTLTFTVKNTGQTPITSVTGTPDSGTFTCGFSSLAPGASGACTLSFPVTGTSHTITLPMVVKDADGGTSTTTFTYHCELALAAQQ